MVLTSSSRPDNLCRGWLPALLGTAVHPSVRQDGVGHAGSGVGIKGW